MLLFILAEREGITLGLFFLCMHLKSGRTYRKLGRWLPAGMGVGKMAPWALFAHFLFVQQMMSIFLAFNFFNPLFERKKKRPLPDSNLNYKERVYPELIAKTVVLSQVNSSG